MSGETFVVCVYHNEPCDLISGEESNDIYRKLLGMVEKIIGKAIIDDDCEIGMGYIITEDNRTYEIEYTCDYIKRKGVSMLCLEVIPP